MSDDTLVQDRKAFPVSYAFKVENVTSDGTPTDGTLASAQGGDGMLVPTGYTFHPKLLQAESNAAITAGTIEVQVTDNGVEVEAGPVVTLSSAAQAAAGIKRHGASSIAAGRAVGVSGEGSATLDAVTKDVDVILVGDLLPV